MRLKAAAFGWGLTTALVVAGVFWSWIQLGFDLVADWLGKTEWTLGEFENWDALAVASGTVALMAGRRWVSWKRFFADYGGLVVVIVPLSFVVIPLVPDFWQQVVKAVVVGLALLLLRATFKDLPRVSDTTHP
ncbi:hypothetical protein C5D44_16340 [Rathayibacter sp. AY1B5]|nr:hypothetical protein C5D44_16340 [Rathayibacter sp. AY1B5]